MGFFRSRHLGAMLMSRHRPSRVIRPSRLHSSGFVEMPARTLHKAMGAQEFKVFHSRVSEPEARALAVARDGGTLEDVCAVFAGESEPAQAAFRSMLSWFADGWVSAVSAGD